MHCTLTYTCTLTYSHSHAHTLAYHAQAHSHMHSAHSHIRHSRYTYIHTHMHTHAYSHTHSHNSHSPIHTPIIHMHTRILTLRHAARFNIHAFHTLIKLHSHSHTLSRAHATCPCSPGPLGGVGAPRLVLLGTTRPSPPSLPRRDPSAAGLCRWPFTGLIRSVSKTLNEFGWSQSGDCAPVCTMPVGRPGATRRSVATRGRASELPRASA